MLARSKSCSQGLVPAGGTPIVFQVGPWRWHCLGGHRAQLFGSDGPNWANLSGDPRADLVKANPVRQVYHVQAEPTDLFVKRFCMASLGARIKRWIKSSPGKREFENLQVAHYRNLPVPKPLAWGEGNGACLLITESVGPAQSLEELLWQNPPATEEVVYRALSVAAKTIAQMHCAGIEHADLHPGNILLVPSSAGDGQADFGGYITDLQSIRIEQRGGHASADPFHRRRIVNVATLFAGIRYKTSPPALRSFIGAYLQALNHMETCSLGQINDYFQIVRRRADAHHRRLWARKARRARRDSKYARKVRLGNGWTAGVFMQAKHPLPDSPASKHRFTPDQWRQALRDPEELLRHGESLKEGGHATVLARTLTVGEATLDIVVKQIRLRQGWRGFLQSFRPSPARKQWLRGFDLVHRRIPTAWPLAALEHRFQGRLTQSLLVCEKIPNACNLHALLRDNPLPQWSTDRSDLARQIGRLVAKLRQRGIRHRDCKAQNILVARRADKGPAFALYLIDLDGLRPRILRSDLARHEAIIRVAVSMLRHRQVNAFDFLRAFHAYIDHLSLPESSDRRLRHTLWRKLEEQIMTMWQKKLAPPPEEPSV